MFKGQYVIFSIENENFAVDITKIKEILNVMEISKVPNVPDFIEGMINMRGNIYAVVNLRSKFNFPKKQSDQDSKILLVNIDGMMVGIIVDGVTEIIKIEESDVDNAPQLISKVNGDFILGIIKRDTNIAMLLDVGKVIENVA
jgi:purine-binding chemotaxis protein CheW